MTEKEGLTMFFVYEDEDNTPMNEDVFDRVMEATNTASQSLRRMH